MKVDAYLCVDCEESVSEPVFCEGCAEALHPDCGQPYDSVYYCGKCWEGWAAEEAMASECEPEPYDEEALWARSFEVLKPLSRWSKQCHAASLELVKAGVADRVARGWCNGVPGQHSWAVIGMDCYDPEAVIIDSTLWSYGAGDPAIFIQRLGAGTYRPHGAGSIWNFGKPEPATGPVIELTPEIPLGNEAVFFLAMLGGLDCRGWSTLAHSPAGGWPAGEILAAIKDTEELAALVPIDRIGMLTDRNPGGLYLRTA